MKKILLFSLIVLTWLGLSEKTSAATIVGFDFNSATKTGAITNNATWITPGYTADYGIAGNINISKISLVGGPTFSARTQGADLLFASSPNTISRNAGSGNKYWMFNFTTLGYRNLTLFSKQQSSATGPRDFKVQYSTGGVIWTDLPGSTIVVDNNFSSGVLNGIMIPTILNNQSSVFLRWIITSNTGVNGGAVAAGGTQRIDNVLVLGEQIFTLTYSGGSNGVVSGTATQSVISGANGTPVTVVANTGYYFVNRSDGSTANPRTDLAVTGNSSLIANYALNQYLYTFQDYNAAVISTGTVLYGSSAIAPSNPTRTGYTFSGWDNSFAVITGNIIITAQYTINQYTLTFNTSGGTSVAPITGDYNSSIIAPVNPTKTGYIFSGWTPTLPSTIPAQNMTFMAQWTDNQAPMIITGATSINEGDSITINAASLTTDVSSIAQYSFDIDNNGTADFTNTSGVLTLTWDQLQSFGITGNNTTLLPTDVYKIRLTATDSSNNIGIGQFQLKVYNISPLVNINAPIISGKIYTGDLPIQWTITDPANQDFPMNTDIFYSKNGSSYVSFSSITSNRTGSIVWDTTTVADGTNYTIRVRTLDDYGNNTATSVPFKIDNTGPVISGALAYTISEGGDVVFALTGTTDAIAGLSGFVWTINATTTGTTTGLLSLNRSDLQALGINNDGIYTIGVQAFDNVGNSTTKNITLTITNVAPTVSISAPSSGIYSGVVNIARTGSDLASADLPLSFVIKYTNGINSGVILQGTNLTNPYARNVSSIPDGTGYRIVVVASDDDTSTTITGSTFSIDHTRPVLSGFASPYSINEGSGMIIDLTNTYDVLAGLVGGVAGFNGKINNISLPTTTNGYWNLSRANLATYGITNGSGQVLPLTINVKDFVGNTANATGTLTVANIAPSVTITSPTATTLTGTITIVRVTTDPIDLTSGEVAYSTGATGPWTVLQSGFTKTLTGITRNTTTVPDGVSYYIRVTATDDTTTTTKITGPIFINNNPTNGYVGGGGGGGSSSNDYCPKGDYSPSYYDGTCGIMPTTGAIATGIIQTGVIPTTVFPQTDIFNSDIKDGYCYTRIGSGIIENSNNILISDEFKKSIAFLYAYDMTVYNNVDKFLPYSGLTRAQAAKMFSNFAINVLCRKPNTSIQPSYTDVANADQTLKPYIIKAYQLGLMKGGDNGLFRPDDVLTKAELNAMLIRLILKAYLPENNAVRYQNYNTVSTKLGIITQGATQVPTTRDVAAIMMFRAYKNQKFSLQTIDYDSYVLDNRDIFLK